MMNRTVTPAALALSVLMLVPTAAASQVSGDDEVSLYDRLGGLPAISLVVSDFMDAFVQDPLIMANPIVRERKTADVTPYIRYQVITMVCQAAGGPCEYAGRDLRAAHEGLGVTPAEWDRMVEIFAATLDRHGVPEPEQEALFAILGPTREAIVRTDGR